MIRKFECKKCHKLFEIDDQGEVRCPDCGSDNVDFAHSHISSKVWKWAAIAIALIGVVVGITKIDWKQKPQASGKNSIGKDTIITNPKDTDSLKIYINDVKLPDEPPKVEFGKLKYDNDSYSFPIVVKNAPSVAFYVALVEHRGDKIISKSEDGKQFSNIPPSEQEEGFYDLVVFDAATNSKLSEPLPVSGFIRQNTVTKMTKEQLQKLINDEDEMLFGINDYILPDCQIRFTNLPKDISKKPTSLADAMGKTGLLWSGLTVSSLEYDNKNRISVITLTVQPLDE